MEFNTKELLLIYLALSQKKHGNEDWIDFCEKNDDPLGDKNIVEKENQEVSLLLLKVEAYLLGKGYESEGNGDESIS